MAKDSGLGKLCSGTEKSAENSGPAMVAWWGDSSYRTLGCSPEGLTLESGVGAIFIEAILETQLMVFLLIFFDFAKVVLLFNAP